MLSLHTIERAIETSDYDRLIRELSTNGLDLPLPLRVRLSSCPAAGLALGLRRVVELTYGPTELSRDITARLLHLQLPGGGFGDGGVAHPDVLATACVITALGRLLNEQPAIEGADHIREARTRAIAALAATQACDGLFSEPRDRAFADRIQHTAFVLALLGEDSAVRTAVRWSELMTWFDEHADRLAPVTERFWEMAKAEEQARRTARTAAGIPIAA